MTNEKKFEEQGYRLDVLKELRDSARSIDGNVEEILDELREHLPDLAGYRNEWHPDDLENGKSYRR